MRGNFVGRSYYNNQAASRITARSIKLKAKVFNRTQWSGFRFRLQQRLGRGTLTRQGAAARIRVQRRRDARGRFA